MITKTARPQARCASECRAARRPRYISGSACGAPAWRGAEHSVHRRAMANVLEVSDLAIRFGSAVVFRGLSFAVPAGSSLAVIGPNGSGKTVLFKALVGSIPYDGTVH